MPASEAKGRNWLPGRTTARNSVTGMSSNDTTSVVGWPMTKAGLIPMCKPAFSPNLRAIIWRVASEMGRRPSMNSPVMRGINSMTAPILIPNPRIPGMPSTSSCPFLQASAPMPHPTNTPRKSGSPRMPNFFFMPSASIYSLLNPGIRSSALLMRMAKGMNPWQKGCGMEMPSILS